MPPTGSSSVDEIKSRLDIVDVISEYVQLKQGGANWKARCPFHHEKTPSFMVNRDRQVFHCFGCQKGGDMFTFIQEIEGIEFAEALRLLAKKAGVKLPTFDPKLQTQKTKLLDLCRTAAIHFYELLGKSDEAKTVRAYLKERGVNDEMVKAFGLGYSANSWDEMTRHLKQQGYKDSDLFEAGLTVKREDGSGFYDRFRGRLIFPIRDVHANVVGFAGRTLEKEVDPGAKYINSPETLIYRKGSIVYGLDLAKQAIREQKAAVLVEGYMDCIASHQSGVTNVVATSGTALTRDQLRLLKRYTTTLVLAFDTDVAGEDAAKRGIDLALQEEFTLNVVRLPESKDPDELIRKDPAAWKQVIAEAKPFMEYLFASVFDRVDLTKVEGKKEAARTLLPFIAKLGDTIEQTHYLQLLSVELKVEERTLRDRISRVSPKAPRASGADTSVNAGPLKRDRSALLAERILALSFSDVERFSETLRELEPWMVSDPPLASLYKRAVLYYTERRSLERDAFRAHLGKEDAGLVQRFDTLEFLFDKDFGQASPADRKAELSTALAALKHEAITRELKRLTEEIRVAEREHDQRKLDSLSERFHQLTTGLR